MEFYDSSKKTEKYTRKSFKENGYQDERVYRPDFIERDPYSNNQPTVWYNQNVAYSSHNNRHSDYYWGSQEIDNSYNESSNSTTTTTSTRRLSACVVVWLVIGFIIIAAGCVTTYFVYFMNNSNNDLTTTTVPSTTSGSYNKFQFIGDITIYKAYWDPDFLNKSSKTCINMTDKVVDMVDAVFKASELKDDYNGSTVQGFRLLNLQLYPIVVLAGAIVISCPLLFITDSIGGVMDGVSATSAVD